MIDMVHVFKKEQKVEKLLKVFLHLLHKGIYSMYITHTRIVHSLPFKIISAKLCQMSGPEVNPQTGRYLQLHLNFKSFGIKTDSFIR